MVISLLDEKALLAQLSYTASFFFWKSIIDGKEKSFRYR